MDGCKLMSTEQNDNSAISAEVNIYMDIWMGLVANSCISVFSILTNLINIALFVQQGLRERVNFTLFWLSVSDFLGALFLILTGTVKYHKVDTDAALLDLESFIISLAWARAMFFDMSSFLTLYIAIERCMCVAVPLTFNTSFIAEYGKPIVLSIVLFVLGNYIPLWAMQRFHTNSNDNCTIPNYEYRSTYMAMQAYNDIAFGVILANICQVATFICTILMYRGLRKSSLVRACTAKVMSENATAAKHGGLTAKELRVVKMVLVLACLYLASSLPQIVYCWARAVLPEFAGNIEFQLMFASILFFIGSIYGALSIFIYYNFSTNFRVAFHHWLYILLHFKKEVKHKTTT